MKKLITILVAFFIGNFAIQAQKKAQREQMTVAQKTDLALKKMVLKLNLTEAQQSQIQPLLAKKIAEKEEKRASFKAKKEDKANHKKLTASERHEIRKAYLDKKIAFKNEMKRILNEDQFKKFEKFASKKKRNTKKGMRKKKNS